MNQSDMWDRLINILDNPTRQSVAYVYRVAPDGTLVKPCVLKTYAYPKLPETLMYKYGGGQYKLLIRQGRRMIFSGEISVLHGYDKK